eukprot:TRINITY_DN43524_c0_g1_i2.p1 TRINITY_DN43524_c0_g1~~TRINITY_DN43524_c0_g1_i2.p1  ORF type:complete len:336 (-),score=31.66 TRINITY_DN43524_c0_g1_i2:164-1171(-)
MQSYAVVPTVQSLGSQAASPAMPATLTSVPATYFNGSTGSAAPVVAEYPSVLMPSAPLTYTSMPATALSMPPATLQSSRVALPMTYSSVPGTMQSSMPFTATMPVASGRMSSATDKVLDAAAFQAAAANPHPQATIGRDEFEAIMPGKQTLNRRVQINSTPVSQSSVRMGTIVGYQEQHGAAGAVSAAHHAKARGAYEAGHVDHTTVVSPMRMPPTMGGAFPVPMMPRPPMMPGPMMPVPGSMPGMMPPFMPHGPPGSMMPMGPFPPMTGLGGVHAGGMGPPVDVAAKPARRREITPYGMPGSTPLPPPKAQQGPTPWGRIPGGDIALAPSLSFG